MSSFRTPAFASLRSALAASAALAASSVFAQTSINLTQDATVRQAGTYTYYARGDVNSNAITPFTTMFYPGGVNHTWANANSMGLDGILTDAVNVPASISFSSGDLTDGTNDSEVRGYINVEQFTASSPNRTGSFDIVFDLGANYVITSVDVTYTDATGWRFSRIADSQQLFTSTANPSSTGDAGLSLFDTGTVSESATEGTLTFSGTSVSAQYVVFRPDMQISAGLNGGSYGAYLYEVAINGYTIPEPSSSAVLFGAFSMGAVLLRRRRRSTV